jgi:hypothetical protein
MTSRKYLAIPAVVGALGMGAGIALANEPTATELMQQIEALQAKVQQLEAKQSSAIAAADVDATVEQVLADANRRSQLMQSEGFTAGWSKGKFMLQSADGNYSLNPNAQFQFRYVVNGTDTDDWDINDGFEVRRLKFGLAGNMFSKDLKYDIVWATNRDGGNLVLEDAVVLYQFADQWAVRAGQFKDPVHHENLVSSKRQLAVERSLANAVLGGGIVDRIQGVGLVFSDEALKAQVVFHDGLNTDNTPWFNAGGSGAAGVASPNWGASARVEYKAFGNWRSYDAFTAMDNKEDLLVIGGGLDFTEAGGTQAIVHTVDVQWENAAGLHVYGAFYGLSVDNGASTYDWGAMAQVGYLIPDTQYEVFGRYSYLDLDEDRGGVLLIEDKYHEITVGVTRYFNGHNSKLTVDLNYLFNGSPSTQTGLGYVASPDDDQIVFRAQYQLLI